MEDTGVPTHLLLELGHWTLLAQNDFMECVLAAIFIFILLSVPLSAVGLSLWPSLGEDALKSVAKRFSGAYFRGGWFRPPRVTFRYGMASAILRINRKQGRTWMEVSVFGTKPGMYLEIAPSTAEGLDEPKRGLRAVYSLSLDPVRPYTVYAEHDYDAQRFLSDAVVMQLKILQRWGDATSLVVVVEPSEIVVRKQWLLGMRNAEPLIEFVSMVMRLHDHVLLGKEQGIEFVAPVQTPLEHVKCAICGEAIGAEYVTCRQCNAPHHLECWKYNGSCGMYACKEMRYEVVRNRVKDYPKNVRWQ
jgi:hypothetical protein